MGPAFEAPLAAGTHFVREATMAAQQGTVRVHRHDRTLTFQVEGWGTMAHSLPLRRFAEQSLAAGVTAIRVDLRRCKYMDSTFLGTLLFLKRAAERRCQGDFALLSPSPECGRLFQQMGLDTVYPVVAAEEPAADAWTELTGGTEDVPAFQRNVVQAHQELADLPGPAGEPFRAVMRCLEREKPVDKAP
jgi:anti-anti-sigma factor